jgi:hypothetical protein
VGGIAAVCDAVADALTDVADVATGGVDVFDVADEVMDVSNEFADVSQGLHLSRTTHSDRAYCACQAMSAIPRSSRVVG